MRTTGRLGLPVGLLGAILVAHGAPGTLLLPTFAAHQPVSLPGGWCRWRGPRHSGALALTFDDGPSPDTCTTLDILAETGMHATFFLLGAQMRAHPNLVRRIAHEGHEIASHGDQHFHHLLSGPAAVIADLSRALETHTALLGHPPRFYRPTYGQVSMATLITARRLEVEMVLWSRWGREFAERHPAPVLERLAPGLTPGAIVLLHDTDVTARPGTAALTQRVLGPLSGLLEDRDLEAVTLSQLVGERAS